MPAVKQAIDSVTDKAKETADAANSKYVEVIDGLNVNLRQNHIKRLREGRCTIELGICFEDLITDLERVSDHCSNIAVCLIQVNEDVFDTHEYLDENVKQTQWFADEVRRLREIYYIPVMKEGV